MKDRLQKLPDDPITCSLKELTLPLSAEFISRPGFSIGGNVLDDAAKLRKQRQITEMKEKPTQIHWKKPRKER